MCGSLVFTLGKMVMFHFALSPRKNFILPRKKKANKILFVATGYLSVTQIKWKKKAFFM